MSRPECRNLTAGKLAGEHLNRTKRQPVRGAHVGQLRIDPDLRVADFVERGGHRGSHTVAGQQVPIPHAFQRTVEGGH